MQMGWEHVQPCPTRNAARRKNRGPRPGGITNTNVILSPCRNHKNSGDAPGEDVGKNHSTAKGGSADALGSDSCSTTQPSQTSRHQEQSATRTEHLLTW